MDVSTKIRVILINVWGYLLFFTLFILICVPVHIVLHFLVTIFGIYCTFYFLLSIFDIMDVHYVQSILFFIKVAESVLVLHFAVVTPKFSAWVYIPDILTPYCAHATLHSLQLHSPLFNWHLNSSHSCTVTDTSRPFRSQVFPSQQQPAPRTHPTFTVVITFTFFPIFFCAYTYIRYALSDISAPLSVFK